MIAVPNLHSGPVKGLSVSFFQPNLIATGASEGEVSLAELQLLIIILDWSMGS